MSKNGLILLTPTSIAYTGTSATISANGSVSFTAVTQLRLNGVFSADYDNYMIVMRASNPVAPNNLYHRYSVGGVDNTDSSFTQQRMRAGGTSVTADRASSLNQTRFTEIYTTLKWGLVFYCYGPYLTQPTASRTTGVTTTSSAGIHEYATTHSGSISFDGINLYPDGGDNISGRVAVYGMRK